MGLNETTIASLSAFSIIFLKLMLCVRILQLEIFSKAYIPQYWFHQVRMRINNPIKGIAKKKFIWDDNLIEKTIKKYRSKIPRAIIEKL